MAKIKFTKGELKRQRDAMRQYQRYLPTLQLKKQQLQIEILHQTTLFEEKEHTRRKKREAIEEWAGLLSDPTIDMRPWITPKEVIIGSRNIAGVDLPVFDRAEFEHAEYDLFIMPLWVDTAIEALRDLVSIRKEVEVLEKGIAILKQELRITTQRVNLFEKVKIPEAQEAIRVIRISLGDEQILEGFLRQYGGDGVFDVHPDLAGGTGGLLGAAALWRDAVDRVQRAFECGDDLVEADLLGRAGQFVASAPAAACFQQAGGLQCRHDVFEVFQRDLLTGGCRRQAHRSLPPVFREFQHRAGAVSRPCGELHCVISYQAFVPEMPAESSGGLHSSKIPE